MNKYVTEKPCDRYGVFTPPEIFVDPGQVQRVQADGPRFAPHAGTPPPMGRAPFVRGRVTPHS